jgi:hypothetical protein
LLKTYFKGCRVDSCNNNFFHIRYPKFKRGGGGSQRLANVGSLALLHSACKYYNKNSKFLCGHRKGHSPFLTPIWSVYTLLLVFTSAHTLLGPFILMLRLVDRTLCLDQLYSCTIIMLSSLCTPVRYFVVTSAHTLLGPGCCTT